MKYTIGLVAAGALAAALTLAGAPEAEAAKTLVSKCKFSSKDCIRKARKNCKGTYDVLGSESYDGSLFDDALPGGVRWYALTYKCGGTRNSVPKFAYRPRDRDRGDDYDDDRDEVNLRDLQRTCRREAANEFDVGPRDVELDSARRRPNGSYQIFGSYSSDDYDQRRFVCRFDRYGEFRNVDLR